MRPWNWYLPWRRALTDVAENDLRSLGVWHCLDRWNKGGDVVSFTKRVKLDVGLEHDVGLEKILGFHDFLWKLIKSRDEILLVSISLEQRSFGNLMNISWIYAFLLGRRQDMTKLKMLPPLGPNFSRRRGCVKRCAIKFSFILTL